MRYEYCQILGQIENFENILKYCIHYGWKRKKQIFTCRLREPNMMAILKAVCRNPLKQAYRRYDLEN